jgi:predicted HicB family RNase H-like nuclease
MPAEKD